MSSEPIITIKNLGKKYNITHQRGGYVALRDVLMNVLKSPFSFLKSKAKQVAGIETKEEFWALKDINLEVQKGEVVGIIGSNGAGKSTLLKILSQITPPTTGEIRINGTVSSLLEVGTGFHPELSGRENIFLNGAILGMTRDEMAKKFDAIVEFAGIEKFLDTQVKHYSSGMYVRLAFSVAAHLEPDILIVDEVLAVGDAEFQKKCLGKMEEVTKEQGRTILFVSHNMGAIQQLCTKCILLEKGKLKEIGDVQKITDIYMNTERKENGVNVKNRHFMPTEIIINEAYLMRNNYISEDFSYGDPMRIQIGLNSITLRDKISFEVIIRDINGYPIIFLPSGLRFNQEFDIDIGRHHLICDIPYLPLAQGKYFIDLILAKKKDKFYDYIERGLKFNITQSDPKHTGYQYNQNSRQGSVHIEADFKKK